jgi:hypothetical protein
MGGHDFQSEYEANQRFVTHAEMAETFGRVGGAETTLPPMTASDDTIRALKTAGRKVAEWTTERDRLIRQAVSEGGSLREVGAAAGVSHTAVKFIAHGRPPKP